MINDSGCNHILNVQFHATTQVSPWYVLLKGTGAVAADDTLAVHNNWSEITTYSGSRKEFVEGAGASKSISNSGNTASFAINGACTVAGAGLASVNTGTGGTLFNAVDFSSPRTLTDGDTLNITMTISSSDDGV